MNYMDEKCLDELLNRLTPEYSLENILTGDFQQWHRLTRQETRNVRIRGGSKNKFQHVLLVRSNSLQDGKVNQGC